MAHALLLILLSPAMALATDIRILTCQEPPTNYAQNDKVVGMIVDVVEKLKSEVGSTATIELLPWARVEQIATSEPNVLIFTLGKSPSRVEAGLQFIGPVATRTHYLWKLKSNLLQFDSLDDAKKTELSISSMRGDWRTKFFQDAGLKVVETNGHSSSVKMLSAKRVDLVPLSDLEMPSVAKEAEIPLNTLDQAMAFRSNALSYLAFSKSTPKETVLKWEKALAHLEKTDFFSKAASKWSGILGNKFSHNKEAGFYQVRP